MLAVVHKTGLKDQCLGIGATKLRKQGVTMVFLMFPGKVVAYSMALQQH